MSETDIRELDPATVDRIAAGEVVERPAAAVKELVENSLDAGADRVEVAIAGDGTERIRVADDGHGMSRADARAAVRKHTTSKIRDLGDLASARTLGFRGEALHAIGSVSRLTITTRPPEGEATELRVEGGEVLEVGPAGRAPGTTVEVEDLFYNTPARRKYLGREATEFGHVNRVVSRYALANPDVAVCLDHDGREVFATTGRGDRREAILAVYGREVAESMVAVEADPDGPVDGVGGHVSDPEVTRSTREYLSTFVNGRYVESATLREAVLAGYGEQLAPDRYPFAVLFLDVPPETVDANVHPRKLEVRFEEEAAVREAVETAVREALRGAGLVRESAPRGRSAPGDAPVRPESPGGTDSERDGEAATEDASPAAAETGATEAAGADADTGVGGAAAGTGDATAGTPGERGETTEEDNATGEDNGTTGASERRAGAGSDRTFRAPTENARLDAGGQSDDREDGAGAGGARREFDRLPAMRVLGQFRETYVVAESEDGLLLVDQHAADERINYERLAAELADDPASQRLVEPAELELTAGEAAVFDAAAAELREVGFEATREGRTARVTAVPAVFADQLDPGLVGDLLAEFLAGEEPDVDAAADDLLADMACYPAITGNTPLAEGSVVGLLEALDDCENPWACPHGRPVVVAVSETELADRFERDYPGHRQRRPEE